MSININDEAVDKDSTLNYSLDNPGNVPEAPTVSEYHVNADKLHELYEHDLSELADKHSKLVELTKTISEEGMSYRMVASLEDIIPGIIMRDYPAEGFTVTGTTKSQQVSLERLQVGRLLAIGGILALIIAFIVKLIRSLLGKKKEDKDMVNLPTEIAKDLEETPEMEEVAESWEAAVERINSGPESNIERLNAEIAKTGYKPPPPTAEQLANRAALVKQLIKDHTPDADEVENGPYNDEHHGKPNANGTRIIRKDPVPQKPEARVSIPPGTFSTPKTVEVRAKTYPSHFPKNITEHCKKFPEIGKGMNNIIRLYNKIAPELKAKTPEDVYTLLRNHSAHSDGYDVFKYMQKNADNFFSASEYAWRIKDYHSFAEAVLGNDNECINRRKAYTELYLNYVIDRLSGKPAEEVKLDQSIICKPIKLLVKDKDFIDETEALKALQDLNNQYWSGKGGLVRIFEENITDPTKVQATSDLLSVLRDNSLSKLEETFKGRLQKDLDRQLHELNIIATRISSGQLTVPDDLNPQTLIATSETRIRADLNTLQVTVTALLLPLIKVRNNIVAMRQTVDDHKELITAIQTMSKDFERRYKAFKESKK